MHALERPVHEVAVGKDEARVRGEGAAAVVGEAPVGGGMGLLFGYDTRTHAHASPITNTAYPTHPTQRTHHVLRNETRGPTRVPSG